MQNVLSTVLFSIVPQLFDVLAASTYLASALEPWIALVVFITVGSYIPLTIAVTEWRGAFRREMNRTDNVKSARATDALLNYETVKLFTNEAYEVKQFGDAIDAYQQAEYQ
jgi:ATP-binding cassette subfamily B (MDR/TAP) protein 6